MDWIGFPLRLRETGMPIGQMQAFARRSNPSFTPLPHPLKGNTVLPNTPPAPDRYRRGLAKLREIDGEAGERVVDSLALRFAPRHWADFTTFIYSVVSEPRH